MTQLFRWDVLAPDGNVTPAAASFFNLLVTAGALTYLNIAPVFTNALATPISSKTAERLRFDDPETVDLFKQTLDSLVQVVPRIAGSLRYLAIGNEIDLFIQTPEQPEGFFLPSTLQPDAATFDPFLGFLDVIFPYAEALFPNALIGVSMTAGNAKRIPLGGTSDPGHLYFAALGTVLARCGTLCATYYSFASDKPEPGSIRSSLDDTIKKLGIASSASGRKLSIAFQEIGYASDDESEQTTFCNELFAAWDARKVGIPYLGFFGLNDWYASPSPDDSCNPCTTTTGCTLPREANTSVIAATVAHTGLVRSDGSFKPSWQEVVDAITARQIPP